MGSRLVTLTGVGGVGKTSLALEVAQELAEWFAEGVWLFELAAVIDAAAVPARWRRCWVSPAAGKECDRGPGQRRWRAE